MKKEARICITAPIISTINDKNEDKIEGTIEGKNVQLDVNRIALKYKFKPIPLIDSNRIVNKSDKRLQFNEKHYNLRGKFGNSQNNGRKSNTLKFTR